MATERADPEALRQRLYRRGASQHDLAAYLRAAEAEAETATRDTGAAVEAASAVERGPSLRPLVIGGAGVLVATALGLALLIGGRAAPVPEPASADAVATWSTASTGSTGSTGSDQVWFVASGTDPVLDGGERDRARGVAVAEGPDMVRYTVASGDTVPAVARRFSLCQGDVLLALPYGVDPGALPPDQMLELSRSSTRSPPDC